ncbi:phospholipase A and acyltransferase 4-like isoform X2 [Solea solea]|uniref:phospholipase A and acyltransferase 4-like isoform X2 n=1 Tax=Solea solea TaxID=90069 RepID=UPI0027299A52|nr:phospholipase A and acyltransferase 4-like isoform X2 [Solea solea]
MGSSQSVSQSDINTKSQSHKLKTLNPGDLIEINRGTFNHWAVYIGNDEVVHLVWNSKGEVRRDKLSDVRNGDNYRVNNFLDKKYKPRNPDVIVKEAKSRIGPSKYYVVTYNCEHFATEMRYGKPESRQHDSTHLDTTRHGYFAFPSVIVPGAFCSSCS